LHNRLETPENKETLLSILKEFYNSALMSGKSPRTAQDFADEALVHYKKRVSDVLS